MRRHKSRNGFFTTLFVIIIIVLLIIFWPFGGKEETKTNNTSKEEGNFLQDIIPEITEGTKAANEEPEEKMAVEGMCEDYTLDEGETVEIDGNEIKVNNIGQTSIKISVNGKQDIISEDDYKRIDGFGVKVNNLFYFTADDENNAVDLRLGCDNSDEDPQDKYVEEKGAAACKEIIKKVEAECIAKFDLDKDYFN